MARRAAIVWFRRDLRLRDHPALRAALDSADRVVPVFCFDDSLLGGRHASGPRTQFMLECLAELDSDLRELGSGLVVRRGRPEREISDLAREIGAEEIHFSRDVSPFARQRGERTREAFEDIGLELHAHPGVNAIDDVGAPRTKSSDKPFTVFSPFHRTWVDIERRDVLRAPSSMPGLPSGLAKGRLPSLEALGLTQEVSDPARGGESEARKTYDRFLDGPIRDYSDNHDALGRDLTSRLSPYLHFGCLSARQIEERIPDGKGPAAFHRQICWRDFYSHVLVNFPRNARSEFQDRYRGNIKWSYAEKAFEKWCEGRTGFPLVDAGMRQLKAEGWMHNRARLVVGSFLTKDMGIDWRWGERWFMRMLIDGDEANNNGNWQWIASVGTDPAPAFRRLYNPQRHAERYDPNGTYVRRYVPELRDVPDEFIFAPHEMPDDVQREVGCVIGEDYPEQMLDHKAAREEALERLRV
ncbi:deoxyribodipyrimidine photo-lyase [Thermoleophilia bacterium SCSIO 60948]|nr:deoxyribodipyrimidine photo-lyase [Thermoleophilia bacterium SCSIO 60948]